MLITAHASQNIAVCQFILAQRPIDPSRLPRHGVQALPVDYYILLLWSRRSPPFPVFYPRNSITFPLLLLIPLSEGGFPDGLDPRFQLDHPTPLISKVLGENSSRRLLVLKGGRERH